MGQFPGAQHDPLRLAMDTECPHLIFVNGNPKFQIQNPKFKIPEPKSEIPDPKSKIQNPKSGLPPDICQCTVHCTIQDIG